MERENAYLLFELDFRKSSMPKLHAVCWDLAVAQAWTRSEDAMVARYYDVKPVIEPQEDGYARTTH